LSEALHKIRNPDLGIKINGSDAIRLEQGDVTLEGACTSFQIHYRVDPSRFCLLWNSIQLVTPLVLGVSANSPLLLGHRLWHETRVPLFKQSIDGRDTSSSEWQEPGRVSFGHGWLQSDPVGLFREMVNLYRPLIPVCSNEEPIATVKNGGTPKLEELCLHDGTVWSWNRPIYDPEIDPHLRIEMRALPAGPTPIDMVANAALFIGLAEGLAEDLAPLLSALPFSYAEYNFYRAAQFGINASVIWPSSNQNSLKERPLIDVIKELLPVAERGLISIGVTADEAKHMLGIIEGRLNTQCNGAVWQLNQYSQLISKNLGQHEACKALVTAYRDRAMANQPVAQWSNI
jgi:gamma-glutamyl:cysteine ligase YbdK (ATP-grasp superfamily)